MSRTMEAAGAVPDLLEQTRFLSQRGEKRRNIEKTGQGKELYEPAQTPLNCEEKKCYRRERPGGPDSFRIKGGKGWQGKKENIIFRELRRSFWRPEGETTIWADRVPARGGNCPQGMGQIRKESVSDGEGNTRLENAQNSDVLAHKTDDPSPLKRGMVETRGERL